MADNTVLNAGSGGDTISTDDIAGVKVQRVKVQHGADGSATDVSTASPLPVTLANTGANSTAVKVDGSAVTQPVSDGGGSLTVDGTVGVSGTVTVDSELTTADLDTGAGTDTRAVVGLVYGASGGGTLVSTTNPLPVGDNGGSLTVDGTVAATQSGNWSVRNQDGSGNSLTSATRGAERALSVQIVDGSGTQVTSFGGSGGTASNFNSAFPSSGTAAGASDGTNMKPLLVDGSGFLKVNVAAGGGSGGTSQTDNATFTRGTTAETPVGAVVESSAPTLTAGKTSALSMGTDGALRVNVTSGGITSGTAGTPSADVVTVQGASGMTAVKVDGSAVTQPVSVSGTAAATQSGTWSVRSQDGSGNALTSATRGSERALSVQIIDGSGSQVTTFGGSGGTAMADGATFTRGTTSETPVGGIAETSAPTLTTGKAAALSLNTSGGLRVDGSAVTQPVSGTVTANAGTGTFNTSSAQSGTWTVQPGNTANSTPWLTTNVPGTSPGSTASRVKAAASTNATSLKGSAGVVLGYALFNNTASAKFFKFYNKASAPTVGTDTPLFTIIVPASGGANVEFSSGIPFATGVAYAITGAIADSDTTAVAADDVHGFVLWK